jgi:beta-glucosidase
MKPQKSELNRRQFLSTVTTAAGLLAIGLGSGASAAEAPPAEVSAARKRVGISDAAYQNAWKRAEALVKQMTLDEKISQLGDRSSPIERLNVPRYNYYTGEALHGLTGGSTATSFPMPLALAACWNPELLLKIYTAVSDEARAYDNRNHIGLSYYSPPTLNLHRDPRWGRCGEAPGEDPCLAGTLAVQVVRGMQGDDPNYLKTTACSKHFICNNTDGDRTRISAEVDPRNFWEYYTRAYRATVLEGDVFTLMSAYSSLNGVPCSASKFLLTDLIRRRWGFRGYVTSDCDAVGNIYDPHHFAATRPIAAAMAVTAGCDLDCGGTMPQNLRAAVNQELVSEDDITLCVVRLFTVRHLLGLFDPPEKVSYTRIPFDVVDSAAHRELALEAARQSLVLLKNDSNFLPLAKTGLKKVAVIGPLGATCQLGGYSGSPQVRISPFEGIAHLLGVEPYRPYVPVSSKVAGSDTLRVMSSPDGEATLGGQNNDWAEFPKMDFTGKTEFEARVSSFSEGNKIEVHLDQQDGPLACTLTVSGTGFRNAADVKAPLTGISGQHSVFLKFVQAQSANGATNAPTAGRGRGRGFGFGRGFGSLLSIAHFQLNPVPAPVMEPGKPLVVFSQGCAVLGAKDDKMFQDAVDTAKSADVVVLVCGVTDQVDGEGRDRTAIGLSGAQPDLVQAIYAANPKTVLVLSSNNTVAVEWEQEHLPAILCAICAGQAQGTAIAEALFGDYNPGGKLCCTWYRSVDQLPDFHDYDISKGRTYMYFGGSALYPFGHGLSYTTFSLDQLQLQASKLGAGVTVNVSVAVANTGKRAGAEVVQLYITPPATPSVKRPIKQLAGFQRVELQPGERKTVTFEVPFTDPAFWYWDEQARQFACQPGTAKVLIGNSSGNLPLTADLTLGAADLIHAEPDTIGSVAVKSRVA